MNYASFAPSVIMLITRFVHLHAMQQLALLVSAQMLPEADLMNRQLAIPWYELFFALDADEDGRLSFGEFAAGLTFLMGSRSGLSAEQMYVLVRALDVDCSGSVDWIEWVAVALLSIPPEAMDPEPLCTAFRLLDRPSGDGKIGAADLLAVINTDASGVCLSATHGRKRVLRLLGRWSSSSKEERHQQQLQQGQQPEAQLGGQLVTHAAATPRVTVTSFSPPPSLNLEDFRRLLESTSGNSRHAQDEVPGFPGSGGGHLRRAWPCPAEPQREAFAMLRAEMQNFSWCRCTQPRLDGTEEVIKAEQMLVVQQNVLPPVTPMDLSKAGRGASGSKSSASGGASSSETGRPAGNLPIGSEGVVARMPL